MDDAELEADVRAVLASAGEALVRLEPLGRHASSRAYYRAHLARGTAVVMRLPAEPFRSDEVTSPLDPPPDELPFLAVHRLLEARGVRVPALLGHDVARRVVVVEDLGDTTFRDRLAALGPEARREAYARAVDLLVDLHARLAPPEPGALVYARHLDRAVLRTELEHFVRWGVEAAWGALAPADRAALGAALDALADDVAALPLGFVHRDFNSRNVMWTARDELAVIDFQDALLGPAPYDLAALLCDSYATLAEPEVEALVDRYARGLGLDDHAALRDGFWTVVAQRKLKDAGRFVVLDRVRGNASFLRWYPPSLAHVGRALAQVSRHHALAERLAAAVPGFPASVRAPSPAAPPE